MADFADIYNAFRDRLNLTLFPAGSGWTRIPDPYNLEANNDQFLRQGWGLALTPAGSNTFRSLAKNRSIEVGIIVPIVRQYRATAHNITAKEDVEKALIADFEALIDDGHKNNFELSGVHSTVISYDGVEAVKPDREDFRAITANITLEYFRRG